MLIWELKGGDPLGGVPNSQINADQRSAKNFFHLLHIW